MGQDKKTPVVIDDKEYTFEDMPNDQKAMVNHIADLDRKLVSARFNVEQLEVGRQAFVNMLSEALKKDEEQQEEKAA